MKITVLDEVISLGDKGVALLIANELGDLPLQTGSLLEDAYGNTHEVSHVYFEDGFYTVHLPHADATQVARLLRDIRVDATTFMLKED